MAMHDLTYETKCNTKEFVLCKSRNTIVVSLEITTSYTFLHMLLS